MLNTIPTIADIKTKEDISILVNNFYKKVVVDDSIGIFFTKIIKLDWEIHIPVMINFWESVLLYEASYKGNAISKHIELNKKSELSQQHFNQWIKLWIETIDENFMGKKAEEAKQKAITMSKLMVLKITDSGNKNFIQ